MKEDYPLLYPNVEVGTKVTSYSNEKSGEIKPNVLQYHRLIKDTEKDAQYTISEFEAKYISWIAHLIGAKRVLEIGVYLGFSLITWADAVGADGHVTGLEFSPEYADRALQKAHGEGYTNTDIVVGDAVKTLAELDVAEPFDIIFIDANKSAYPDYLRIILERSQPGAEKRLLRKDGLIVADNVLRWSLLPAPGESNPNYQLAKNMAIRWNSDDLAIMEKFNTEMATNPRLDPFLLPMFDGVGHARLRD